MGGRSLWKGVGNNIAKKIYSPNLINRSFKIILTIKLKHQQIEDNRKKLIPKTKITIKLKAQITTPEN